jgi:hypothetical protein
MKIYKTSPSDVALVSWVLVTVVSGQCVGASFKVGGKDQVKGKVYPRTGHEGLERE